MSEAGRIYVPVQNYITDRLVAGKPPKTPEIIAHIYGKKANQDSRKQKDAVYQAILRGRDRAIAEMDFYMASPKYVSDMTALEYYANTLIDEEEGSSDYAEFFSELHMGRFGDKSDLIKGHLREFALIAALWKKNLEEYSKKNMNLVVANYGRNSIWFIPSWWKWAIRETKLYMRTLKIVEKQMTRGIGLKMITASGQPLTKAIGYVGSARALLENSSSWACRCEMVNLDSANFCSNCGSPKP